MGKTIDEILINKKIKVTPIIRNGGNLPKGHDGEFMFTDATFSTTVPLDSQRIWLRRIMLFSVSSVFVSWILSTNKVSLSSLIKK